MPFTLKDASGADVQVSTPEEIAEMITGATRSQIEKANKKLTADITKSLGDSVSETMAQYEAKRAEEAEKAKTPAKPADPLDIENHPAFKGMKKQLDDAAKKITDAETATQLERAKTKELALRATLEARLKSAGFDADRVHLTVGTLIDAQKRVRYGDDDSITFRGDDNEEVDLETGLKGWAQTKDGKSFMPPRGASGSGDRPGGKALGQGQTSNGTTADLGRSVLAAAGFITPDQ